MYDSGIAEGESHFQPVTVNLFGNLDTYFRFFAEPIAGYEGSFTLQDGSVYYYKSYQRYEWIGSKIYYQKIQ